jgi:hypothetical protein
MPVESDADLATFFNVAEFGVAATYLPPTGGQPLACTILMNRADREMAFGQGRPVVDGTAITFQAREIATPLKGGAFKLTATGQQLRIIDDPVFKDMDRKIWTCSAR